MLLRLMCLALCAALGACASSRVPPPADKAWASPGEPRALLALPPGQAAPAQRTSTRRTSVTSAPTPITPAPAYSGPISASNPSTAIIAVNRSVPQPLGPNSPPPSSFENSCAPAPYLFQSKAGYEAVRVKDCRNDQLVYLPSSAQAQIGDHVAECRRRCGI